MPVLIPIIRMSVRVRFPSRAQTRLCKLSKIRHLQSLSFLHSPKLTTIWPHFRGCPYWWQPLFIGSLSGFLLVLGVIIEHGEIVSLIPDKGCIIICRNCCGGLHRLRVFPVNLPVFVQTITVYITAKRLPSEDKVSIICDTVTVLNKIWTVNICAIGYRKGLCHLHRFQDKVSYTLGRSPNRRRSVNPKPPISLRYMISSSRKAGRKTLGQRRHMRRWRRCGGTLKPSRKTLSSQT